MKLSIDKKNGKTIYNVKFDNLADLYYYLKSNPTVNSTIFNEQASLTGSSEFAGAPLKESIDYIVDGYNRGFNNFLVASERMQNATIDVSDNRSLRRGLYGGIPLAPLVAAEVPECMLKYDRKKEGTIRNMYFSLSYPHYVEDEEIFNRGLATLYIVEALEKKGDIVNFVARETAECGKEIVNIEVVLKKPSDMMLDIKKCYFPLVGREFLRRILFRVKESIPFEVDWSWGYGRTLEEEPLREFFNLKDTDYVISTPNEIGISGGDIYRDTARLIENLDLEEEFDVPKIKKLSR